LRRCDEQDQPTSTIGTPAHNSKASMVGRARTATSLRKAEHGPAQCHLRETADGARALEESIVDGRPTPSAIAVLHVEDDHLLQLTIGARIAKEGIEVEIANNGEEALARVRRRVAECLPPFSLILMDNQVRSATRRDADATRYDAMRTRRKAVRDATQHNRRRRARGSSVKIWAGALELSARVSRTASRVSSPPGLDLTLEPSSCLAPHSRPLSAHPQMPLMGGSACTSILRRDGFKGLICGMTGDPFGSEDRMLFEAAGLDECVDKTPAGLDSIICILRLQKEKVATAAAAAAVAVAAATRQASRVSVRSVPSDMVVVDCE
jgi:CheY-like chemotaxis protein